MNTHVLVLGINVCQFIEMFFVVQHIISHLVCVKHLLIKFKRRLFYAWLYNSFIMPMTKWYTGYDI